MSVLKNKILSVIYVIKSQLSNIKLWLGKRLGLIRSIIIVSYHGFGNEKQIFLLGRVIKDRGVGISQLDDSNWMNFKKMYKRFASWEIPKIKVKAQLNGSTHLATTDEEGYFEFNFQTINPIDVSAPFLEIQLELVDQVIKKQQKVWTTGKLYFATSNTEFGVISDIDDTIVPTGATKYWEMIRTTLFGNAHSRIPFPGVSAFYNSLHKGKTRTAYNPFFYVSSSPWNIYDFLMEFLMVHKIPQGPLMLRDLGVSKEHIISGSHVEHKLTQVERIFTIVKDITFILIGDSGQHDAEIYLQVIKDFPGRVKMVYIRDVDDTKHEKMVKIGNQITQLGVEFLLIKDTMEAAHHAQSKGWIWDNSIKEIALEKELDEKISN